MDEENNKETGVLGERGEWKSLGYSSTLKNKHPAIGKSTRRRRNHTLAPRYLRARLGDTGRGGGAGKHSLRKGPREAAQLGPGEDTCRVPGLYTPVTPPASAVFLTFCWSSHLSSEKPSTSTSGCRMQWPTFQKQEKWYQCGTFPSNMGDWKRTKGGERAAQAQPSAAAHTTPFFPFSVKRGQPCPCPPCCARKAVSR